MEALHKFDLAIVLLEYRTLFFCFFLRNLASHSEWIYWLQIREIPQFQAKVSISMILLEVIEPSAVVDVDG
jgi:hypothetical protein